jgi:hypothetical protein
MTAADRLPDSRRTFTAGIKPIERGNVKINRRAVVQGTLVFLALYCIHLLVLPMVAESFAKGDNASVMFGVHQLLGLATCLVSGYVAGSIAGEKGFFYGLGVGAMGTLISALAAVIWSLTMGARFPELQRLPFWIMINGFLSAFAGLLATYTEDEGNTVLDRTSKQG